MHLSHLAGIIALPALAAAINYEITHWTCLPTLDLEEPFELDSVRDYGTNRCEGYELRDQYGDGWIYGGFSGNPGGPNFGFGPNPNNGNLYQYGATFPDHVEVGTCVPPPNIINDYCETAATVCSITVTYQCTAD